MQRIAGHPAAPPLPLALPVRTPLQHWLMFQGVSLLGFVLLGYFGLLQQMLVADRTLISAVITLLYGVTTLHCLWRTAAISREGDAARLTAELVRAGPLGEERLGRLPAGQLAGHIQDLVRKAGHEGTTRPDQALLLRGLAARLRGSNALGHFASDTLMKLGLVGTIVGFIIMLQPMATLDPADPGAVRTSMGLMSDGMAIAMYTTLAGLIGSILVKIQYYMLDEATNKLFAFIVRLVEVDLVLRPPGAATPAR